MAHVVLWTTGNGASKEQNNDEEWRNTYFWSEEDVARDNAEAGGHALIRVTLEVKEAEVVWSPPGKDDTDLDLTPEEYIVLQAKYAGREFVFHSPFEDTPGWKDGDRGILVRLIRVGTEDVEEVNDLWVGLNLTSGGLHQLWGGEAFTPDGNPVVDEQRFVNWSPNIRKQLSKGEDDA